MDKETKSGYIAGILFLLVFFAFLSSIINIGLDKLDLLYSILTATFGILGFGSLWKPKTIGAVATALIEMFTKDAEKSSSHSHNKQVQRKSSGVQVMTGDQSNVNVIVHSGKKGQTENPKEEGQKEFLRKETIEMNPSDSFYYEFEFPKKDHLRGEISSTSRIDIHFLDEPNFDKWSRGRRYFEPEESNEGVLETNIDYEVPKRGTWYVIIENNGRKTATVKVLLY